MDFILIENMSIFTGNKFTMAYNKFMPYYSGIKKNYKLDNERK